MSNEKLSVVITEAADALCTLQDLNDDTFEDLLDQTKRGICLDKDLIAFLKEVRDRSRILHEAMATCLSKQAELRKKAGNEMSPTLLYLEKQARARGLKVTRLCGAVDVTLKVELADVAWRVSEESKIVELTWLTMPMSCVRKSQSSK